MKLFASSWCSCLVALCYLWLPDIINSTTTAPNDQQQQHNNSGKVVRRSITTPHTIHNQACIIDYAVQVTNTFFDRSQNVTTEQTFFEEVVRLVDDVRSSKVYVCVC
jgi:hypothetical protein